MSLGTLKKDIFNLGQGGLALEDIECPGLDPLKTARYSCRFWVHHLEQSQRASLAAEAIYVFLSQHFLHWVEAMSLMRMAPEIVGVIDTLHSLMIEVRYC